MRKILILCTMAVMLALSVTSAFAANVATGEANGIWSPHAQWLGDQKDHQGKVLARKIRAKVVDRQMTLPVYDVSVDFQPTALSTIFPITLNTMDMNAGFPTSIVWIGRYNGFNEETAVSYSGNERIGTTRFTVTTSESGNKFYGLEGVINWNPNTKRPQDRICVFWDSTLRAHVYLGATFDQVMKVLGINTPVPGYERLSGHDWLEY